jgi:DNA-binding response OmpR family regulator
MQIKSVLIVEDEPFNAKFVSKILNNHGIEKIVVVDNADDAIDVVKSTDISLIFMDININGSVDGIICAKKIQFIKNIPIIFISAINDNEVLHEAIDKNTVSYILKPFGEAEVLVALKLFENKTVVPKPTNTDTVYFQNDFTFCFKNNILYYQDKAVLLTAKELQLVSLFVKNLDAVLSVETVSSHLWPNTTPSQSRLRELMVRLRKKIPQLQIQTSYAQGYILKR